MIRLARETGALKLSRLEIGLIATALVFVVALAIFIILEA